VADTFSLTVKLAGDAFHPDPLVELRRLLLDVAGRLEEGALEGVLRDVNGNAVGLFGLEEG
jgi:hypothetical protein